MVEGGVKPLGGIGPGARGGLGSSARASDRKDAWRGSEIGEREKWDRAVLREVRARFGEDGEARRTECKLEGSRCSGEAAGHGEGCPGGRPIFMVGERVFGRFVVRGEGTSWKDALARAAMLAERLEVLRDLAASKAGDVEAKARIEARERARRKRAGATDDGLIEEDILTIIEAWPMPGPLTRDILRALVENENRCGDLRAREVLRAMKERGVIEQSMNARRWRKR